MKDIFKDHYLKPRIKEHILDWCSIEEPKKARRALVASHRGWYRYRENKEGEAPQEKTLVPATEEGYDKQINRMERQGDRSLYHSLNYFEPTVFREWVDHWPNDDDKKEKSPGGYKETIFYGLGTDIDLKDKKNVEGLDRDRIVTKAEDREWLEKALKFHIDWLKDYGISKKIIKPYFSGNGAYVSLDPSVVFLNCEPQKAETICRAYDKIIKQIEKEFFKQNPEAETYVKFDSLNNSKRQWKTILSIHKSKPFACIPLDVDNPKIDLEKAKLPLSDQVIQETKEWIQKTPVGKREKFTKEVGELIRKPILEDGKTPREKAKEKLIEDTGLNSSKEPLNVEIELTNEEAIPPCIQKLLNAETPLSHARGKGLLAFFFYKIGLDKNEAREKWTELCNAAGGPKTNIFESWWEPRDKNGNILNLPSCETIRESGSGYPSLEMGDIGLCEPDEACQKIKSLAEYLLLRTKNKKRLVEKWVNLPNFGKVKIGFSDLYQKANSTRGSFHIWVDSDHHHFEEDRKLSNQNIKRFIRDGIELYNLKEEHEAKLYKKFALLKDKAREEAAKETAGLENDGVEKEELDVEEENIYEILEGEPLIELHKRTNKVHKGDSSLKMLAWISGLSRSVLDYPINLWPVGTTGSGKTHLFETVSRAIPSEYMLKFDSCSPKSMYYFCREYGEDALDGKIAFFNEVEASDEAKVLLRGLTDPTKGQNRLLTVEEQQMLEININGLPVTWFTSVNPLEDEELKNRFLFCNPEESKNHKNDVAEHQMKYIQEGILQPIKIMDFPELKAAFREIVEAVEDKKVLIPYEWDWGIKEEARLQPFFGAIVMAMAKIHHRTRPQTDEYIIATLEDFYLAKLIFHGLIKETLGGVKDKDLEIYEILGESKQGWKSRSDIAEELGISTGQARYSADRLVDSGLANSHKSDGVWYYWKSQKEVVKPVVSISTSSLASDKLKEFLEEKEIACVEIAYTEGGRWGSFKPQQITHLAPSVIENFTQATNIEGEDLEKIFSDYEGVKLDFTSNTGGNTEEADKEEEAEELGEVEELKEERDKK